MELTIHQREAITATEPLVLCVAGAGSGKTTLLTDRIKALIQSGVDPNRVVAITFTNAAAQEVERRLEGVTLKYVGTLHGYMLRLIQTYGNNIGFTGRIGIADPEQCEAILSGILLTQRLVSKRKKVQNIIDQGPMVKRGRMDKTEIAASDFFRTLREANLLSFDTILWYGLEVIHALRSKAISIDVDHLLVDEFQDSSGLDAQIYKAMPAQDKFFVGDPDQCQPAGTHVRMSDGSEKPIQQIAPGDSVVSYARHENVLLRTARVRAVARHPFCGLLYSVSAAGLKTECTGNHRWLIKWLSGAERTRNLWTVYLMRQGDRFRVGKTCLFRSGSGKGDVLGLPLRMRQECADAGWILSVHGSEGEAVAQEDIVAAVYGLPQTYFNAGNAGYSQGTIDKIFSAIPKQLMKAAVCLQNHGRDLEFPLFHKGQPRTRRTVQEIHACNLLNAVMRIPICPGPYDSKNREGTWTPVEVTTREFMGEVFSLDVEKHHKYVSNGLVTCNSIYSFRGGDVSHINALALEPGVKLVMLEENFRCASEICSVANLLISHQARSRLVKVTRSQTGIEGHVETWNGVPDPFYEQREVVKDIKEHSTNHNDVAVLCRNNHHANEMADILAKAGIKVATKVQDELPKDWKLARVIIALLTNPDNDLMAGLYMEMKHGLELANIKRLRAAEQLRTINDVFLKFPRNIEPEDVLRFLASQGVGVESIERVKLVIAILPAGSTILDLAFTVGGSLEHKEEVGKGVTVTTIHSAKGREWHTVYLPSFEQVIIPSQRKNVNVDEERRLAYVGFTRAKERLVISWCKERTAPWKRTPDPMQPSQFLTEAGLVNNLGTTQNNSPL